MAKITGYDPPPEYVPLIERAVRTLDLPTGTAARLRLDPAPPHTDPQLAHLAHVREALSAWAALSLWKRARWTICAYRRGNPANPPTGARGASGTALYIQQYITQNIHTPHQPVSPCARRRIDPNANPWDFTP